MIAFITSLLTKKELSHRAFQLLQLTASANDIELYADDWPYAQELVKSGFMTLGKARGPLNQWKNAVITEAGKIHHKSKINEKVH